MEHDQKLELFRVRCIPVDWKQVTQILQRCIKNYIEKETSLPKKKDESKPDKEYDDHDIESFDQDIRNVFDPYATVCHAHLTSQQLLMKFPDSQPEN